MPESELIKFRGEVVFEIQVKVFLPFVSIATPAKDAVIKRGTTRIIEWTGANANTKLQLDLYHDEVKLASIESTDNTGKLKWSVPSSLKPGTNYKILIFDSNKSDNRAFSSPFLIKRKIPTALKVSISVLGAGIVGYLLSNLPNGGTKAPSKLPSPPDVN
jgi:hypothetical protein